MGCAMKGKRIYFENGRIKRDNVTYLMPAMPPEFKELADTFFDEMKRLAERMRDGSAAEKN